MAATRVFSDDVPLGWYHADDDTPRVPRDASYDYIPEYGFEYQRPRRGYKHNNRRTGEPVSTPAKGGSRDVGDTSFNPPAPISTATVNYVVSIARRFLIDIGVLSVDGNAMTML